MCVCVCFGSSYTFGKEFAETVSSLLGHQIKIIIKIYIYIFIYIAGEHLKNLIIQINKHKSKAAAPHGRLPHTKHKLKSRPGPLSSCTVVAPPFILPELLRGDSRPVSGAGVAHHH